MRKYGTLDFVFSSFFTLDLFLGCNEFFGGLLARGRSLLP